MADNEPRLLELVELVGHRARRHEQGLGYVALAAGATRQTEQDLELAMGKADLVTAVDGGSFEIALGHLDPGHDCFDVLVDLGEATAAQRACSS